MNTQSRIHNTITNAIVNVGGQIVTLVINFLTRIIFINAFGENYLGINGLFSNILSILSLAELGVGSAIIYSMYKPIAEKDYPRLSALMNYYKKLYHYIGGIVAAIGLLLVPFLKYLVNIETDIGNVTVYYLLYLMNTVSSYFLVYKTAILTADQKNYIIKVCNVVISLVQFVVLAFVALAYKNYYVYLALHIAFSILNNYICSKIAEKKYPFIIERYELGKEDKKSIWSSILAMFSYQVGNVILNNTDNILISVMISTVTVGFYSNYSMIIVAVATFMQLIFTSLQASIGNLAAEGNEEKQSQIFNVIQFASFWMTSFCCISFAVLFQDFITMLYTDHYLLDYSIVLICVFNFYVQFILYPIYCFRSTVGLFKQTKWIMLFTSATNLILSITLGKYIGLAGILFATGISRLVTNFWFEPIKLFKVYFKKSPKMYFIKQLFYCLFTMLMVFGMLMMGSLLNNINLFFRFFIKVAMCAVIPNTLYFVIFRKNENYKYIVNVFGGKFRGFLNRKA